ncbi:SDR family oxidoreductase [Saccharopolyspora sp. K220]|uniref:SDR family NAD(P)-dependent oxidoreductase n=1 Tax=Saccharopolyspora soli TaxID=2926618 RepID=UPI001F571B75|nr:SDR family NAD(P)-dependent oxidoreductase [Saccharopolyspora soli]MCI2415831.1 SDR family oxidoreductase [Saccharopolyspora soli]
MTRFIGKRALVTGVGRGIGRAIVERLAAERADVVVADIDATQAEAVAAAARDSGGTAESLPLDIADAAMVERAAQRLGQLDIVVANAGIQTFAPVTELSTADWDRVLDVNARGALLTLQLAARCLGPGGSIVTIASIQGLLPNALSANYAASKAAVLSLTKSFAAELAPRRIRVNAVAPGRIDTELSDYASAEVGKLTGQNAAATIERRIATNPLGRTGRPDEIAAVVAFLASADASYITGECINVCGGDVML